MPTRKITCPSCEAGLRLSDTVPEGRSVKCPKCGGSFPVPGRAGDDVQEETAPHRPNSPTVRAAAPRSAPPQRTGKSKKHRKAVSEQSHGGLVFAVVGGAILIVMGIVLAVVFTTSSGRSTQASGSESVTLDRASALSDANRTEPPARAAPVAKASVNGETRAPVNVPATAILPVSESPTGGGSGPISSLVAILQAVGQAKTSNAPGEVSASDRQPVQVVAGSPAVSRPVPARVAATKADAKESGQLMPDFTIGKQVFAQNCARCHRINEDGGQAVARGGPPGGSGAAGGRAMMGRGPNLSHVGGDPDHTVDWFIGFIRNPKSERPSSRMPPFEGKIQPDQLRALAEYLTSLE